MMHGPANVKAMSTYGKKLQSISIFGSGEGSMQLLTTQVNLYHIVNTYIAVKVNTLASCIELWTRVLLRASVSARPEEQYLLYR